jgi:enoyl-[acyl-carrier protein] reductase/trans-2-enoyl-CoA reductase (NAD+)
VLSASPMSLETFKKLPLGGVDRRAMVGALAEHGRNKARAQLVEERARLRPAGTRIAKDAAVLMLGGSNGITRGLAVQLLFGERASVFGVHLDSEKMQIGPHHVAAIEEAAAAEGLTARFFNADATKTDTIAEVIAALKAAGVRAVHLVNGIAAGATKRYQEHGPTQVRDLDVAFDVVLQTPDFSRPESIRKLGLVEVEVATDVDIERTNKFMGTSSLLWAEPLAEAGLLVRGESVVAFCDYDYPKNDPVYAMGPLAGAKVLQRETMATIRERYGVVTSRLCYPAVATTALGAIPGGLLMYALTAQILAERGQLKGIPELSAEVMAIFREGYDGADLRIDAAYQETLPEFFSRRDALTSADVPAAFSTLFGRLGAG